MLFVDMVLSPNTSDRQQPADRYYLTLPTHCCMDVRRQCRVCGAGEAAAVAAAMATFKPVVTVSELERGMYNRWSRRLKKTLNLPDHSPPSWSAYAGVDICMHWEWKQVCMPLPTRKYEAKGRREQAD
jgi:hypothetical protein